MVSIVCKSSRMSWAKSSCAMRLVWKVRYQSMAGAWLWMIRVGVMWLRMSQAISLSFIVMSTSSAVAFPPGIMLLGLLARPPVRSGDDGRCLDSSSWM